MRVSTVDQNPETQLHDLRQMAAQRGYQIVAEFTDRLSGTKAKRPGHEAMLRDGRRGGFDVVLVWASDRIATIRLFQNLYLRKQPRQPTLRTQSTTKSKPRLQSGYTIDRTSL